MLTSRDIPKNPQVSSLTGTWDIPFQLVIQEFADEHDDVRDALDARLAVRDELDARR
jgi:hypothetical protein